MCVCLDCCRTRKIHSKNTSDTSLSCAVLSDLEPNAANEFPCQMSDNFKIAALRAKEAIWFGICVFSSTYTVSGNTMCAIIIRIHENGLEIGWD